MENTGEKSKKCCSLEKQELIEEIRSCDFCSTSWDEHHRCLSRAAKNSGRRARSCMFA